MYESIFEFFVCLEDINVSQVQGVDQQEEPKTEDTLLPTIVSSSKPENEFEDPFVEYGVKASPSNIASKFELKRKAYNQKKKHFQLHVNPLQTRVLYFSRRRIHKVSPRSCKKKCKMQDAYDNTYL